MTFRLIMQTSTGARTEYPLEKAEIFLGRDLSNDIVINDPEVSRRHARLVKTGNVYAIEDLGSTNGTFLRGQRLSGLVVLISGEIVTFGEKVLLKYEETPIDPNATVAAFRRPAPSAIQPVEPVAPVVPAVPQYTPPAQPPTPQYVPQEPAAPKSTPAPVFVSQQPPQQPAPPVYASQQPVQQVYPPVKAPETGYQEPPVKKKKSGWVTALLVVIAVLLVFCVIPWVIIEITDSYCSLFPGIFNSIQPGACPSVPNH